MTTEKLFCLETLGEDVTEILEKAHCTIAFAGSYVVKFFNKGFDKYDEVAIAHEYEWDKKMSSSPPLLFRDVKYMGMSIFVLVLTKFPKESNLMFKMLHHEADDNILYSVCKHINEISDSYEAIQITPDDMLNYYIQNISLQIARIGDKIPDHLNHSIRNFMENTANLNLFKKAISDKKAVCVHGNMFSSNIYYYKAKTTILDPLSYNHFARKSCRIADLATFFADIRIFQPLSKYLRIFKRMSISFDENDLAIFQLYIILKILVRYRFALMEYRKGDNYISISNHIVIKRSTTILEMLI